MVLLDDARVSYPPRCITRDVIHIIQHSRTHTNIDNFKSKFGVIAKNHQWIRQNCLTYQRFWNQSIGHSATSSNSGECKVFRREFTWHKPRSASARASACLPSWLRAWARRIIALTLFESSSSDELQSVSASSHKPSLMNAAARFEKMRPADGLSDNAMVYASTACAAATFFTLK